MPLGDLVGVAVSLAVPELVEVPVTLGVGELLRVLVDVAAALRDRDGVGDLEAVMVAVVERLGVLLGEALTEGDLEEVPVWLIELVALSEPVPVELSVLVLVQLRVVLAVALAEPVPVSLPVLVLVELRVAVTEPLGELVLVSVLVLVELRDAVAVELGEMEPVRLFVPEALLEPVLVTLDVAVPVALGVVVPVSLAVVLLVMLPERVAVPVAPDDAVPVTVELAEPVLVEDAVADCEGDCVLVLVTEGTSTVGSESESDAARSTGLMPVDAVYASKNPAVDSESSNSDEPPSSSLDCTLFSAVTRLDAVSCCAPVTSLMLEPAVVTAGITMRRETPLLPACNLRAPTACTLRPPRSSVTASWNQMARPGPSSASEVTHCSLCMG